MRPQGAWGGWFVGCSLVLVTLASGRGAFPKADTLANLFCAIKYCFFSVPRKASVVTGFDQDTGSGLGKNAEPFNNSR